MEKPEVLFIKFQGRPLAPVLMKKYKKILSLKDTDITKDIYSYIERVVSENEHLLPKDSL